MTSSVFYWSGRDVFLWGIFTGAVLRLDSTVEFEVPY